MRLTREATKKPGKENLERSKEDGKRKQEDQRGEGGLPSQNRTNVIKRRKRNAGGGEKEKKGGSLHLNLEERTRILSPVLRPYWEG